MNCTDVRDWLRRDLDGAAEPSSEVAEHLERCVGCTAEAGRQKELARSVRAALPRASVPVDFTARVAEAVTGPVGELTLEGAVRPRRRRLFVPVLLVAAALLVWLGPRFGGGEAHLAGTGPDGALVFELSAQGQLKQDGAVLSLDQVAALLKKRAAVAGFEGAGLTRRSRLEVVLRADRKAVWRHAQWFLVICAENKAYRTYFALGQGRAEEAFLPVGNDIRAGGGKIKVAIGILSRGARPGAWGPPRYRQRVSLPTGFAYHFGDRTADSIEEAAQWIADAKRAAKGVNVTVVGEIKAPSKVVFGRVFDLLARFHEAGIEQVQFYGTPIPTAIDRRRPFLPYPIRLWGAYRTRRELIDRVRRTRELAAAFQKALDGNDLDKAAAIKRDLDEAARLLERARKAMQGKDQNDVDVPEEEIVEEPIKKSSGG